MPAPFVSMTLEMTALEMLIASLDPRTDAILDKVSFDVEARAKMRGRVDTGAMINSVYVSGASGGMGTQYSNAASAAQGLRPGVELADEVVPQDRFSRVVGVSVHYAYWQELLYPFLSPAVEEVRPGFNEAWQGLFAP